MNRLKEADRYVGGESMPGHAVLRLAAHLTKDKEMASKTNVGLYEVARERILVHLLRTDFDSVRVEKAKREAHALLIRAGKGRRAPPQTVPIDHLPADLLESLQVSLDLGLTATAEQGVRGLNVGEVDASLRSIFDGMTASDCLSAGRRAEEQYDYERALAAFRLAVLRSAGELRMVRELVRFLTEIYADSTSVAELLRSPVIKVSSCPDLQEHLADALFQIDEWDQAKAQYELLLKRSDAPVPLKRLGQIALKGAHLRVAEEYLSKALHLDPSDNETRSLLNQCRGKRGDEAGEFVSDAREALKNGDLDTADKALDGLTRRRLNHPQADRLRASIQQARNAAKAAQLIEHLDELVSDGQWRRIVQTLRRAHSLDPSVRTTTTELLEKALTEVAGAERVRYLQKGAANEKAGDVPGALEAFLRAVEAGASPVKDAAESPIFAMLAAYLARHPDHHPDDRELSGLADAYQVTALLAENRVKEAEHALREARRHLGDDVLVTELRKQVGSAGASRRKDRFQTLIETADKSEADGDLTQALTALDRAVEMGGAADAKLESRRQRIRKAIAAQKSIKTLHSRLSRLAKDKKWWQLRRELDAIPSGNTYEVLRSEADAQLTDISKVASIKVKKAAKTGRLDLDSLGIDADQQDNLIVEFDDTSGRGFIALDRQLVILSLPDLSPIEHLEWAESLNVSVKRPTARLFVDPSNDCLLVFDAVKTTLTRVSTEAGKVAVVDQLDLSRVLPPASSPELQAAETVFDPKSGRLLNLSTGQTKQQPSRLVSISAVDGAAHHEERFSYPVFNLKHIRGDNLFTLQRLLDINRPQAHFYNFMVVDAHAKALERHGYMELDEPMHAIRRIAKGTDHAANLFCSYWFIEPFTGQVLNESNGFVQFKPSWEIFYQTSQPELWFKEARGVCAAFALARQNNLLLIPWRRTRGQTGYGVSALSVEQFREEWDVEMPPEAEITCLFEDQERPCAYILLLIGENLSLRQLDLEKRKLLG
jgi:tetratricopeptide (TPR) repeat protein